MMCCDATTSAWRRQTPSSRASLTPRPETSACVRQPVRQFEYALTWRPWCQPLLLRVVGYLPVEVGDAAGVSAQRAGVRQAPGAGSCQNQWLQGCHFHAIVCAMKATIDAAGRIVVPKALRQALGLKPGQPLEIRAGDGRLEIEIAATPMKLQKRGKGVVAVPDAELPALTADQVRDTLERVRR